MKELKTSKLFIPSSTGEYTPTNITTEYDVSEIYDFELDAKLDDELTDNDITLIYSINIEEAPKAFEELLKTLLDILHDDFIAPSDFYHYIPDLINQMQHIGYLYSINSKDDILPWGYPRLNIRNFDNNRNGRGNLKDSLEDQCNFCDNDCSLITKEQDIIHRVINQLQSDKG